MTSGLLDLPPELRVQIWELAVGNDNEYYLRRRSNNKHLSLPEPPILQVTKQIRREALSAYFKQNSFRIELGIDDFPSAADHMRTIARRYSHKPFGNLCFYVTHVAWDKIGRIYPLLEAVRSSNLHLPRPEARGIFGERIVFPALYITHRADAIEKVLRLGIALAESAVKESWAEEELRAKFVEWIEAGKDCPYAKNAMRRIREKRMVGL